MHELSIAISIIEIAQEESERLGHGLAGSAAAALLVLTTIRDPRWALWYLLIFGFAAAAAGGQPA